MKEQLAVIQQDRYYYFLNNYLLGDLCWHVRLCRANKKSIACFVSKKKWCKLAGKDKLRVNINKWP